MDRFTSSIVRPREHTPLFQVAVEEGHHPLVRSFSVGAFEPVIGSFNRLQFRIHADGQKPIDNPHGLLVIHIAILGPL